MKGTVLLIDDEKNLRTLLKRILELESYQVWEAGDLKTAWKILEQQPVHVVLSDVKLPDGNGVDFTQQCKSRYPPIEIIVMTAFGTIQDGVKAMKYGAVDYLVKGDDNEKIIPLLSQVMEKAQTHTPASTDFAQVLGKSKAIQTAITLARKVAKTDTTVLLTGETGTGKEVFAQAIHQASDRQPHPFVALNCAAFSKELLESELFGHKAGAFTGAIKDKKGLFEEAHLGTLFLDEIGEMPLDLQAKFLRVLEMGSFIKVGDTKLQKVQVRIIAATNRDLSEEVAQGRFRADLYYRLAIFPITLPPLRERKSDIPLLVEAFLQIFAKRFHLPLPQVSDDCWTQLQQYDWPGNIRELRNCLERAIILCDDAVLTAQVLPYTIQYAHLLPQGHASFALQSVEKQHIQKVLQHTQGNKTEAARLLHIGLTTLYRKIEEYGIV